jgi:hypothetical protein
LAQGPLDVPAEVPLGLLRVQLRDSASFLVGADHLATGTIPLTVSLPLSQIVVPVDATATLRGISYPYDQFDLDMMLEVTNRMVRFAYPIHFTAHLAQDADSCKRIEELIDQLDALSIEKRDEAFRELLKIGRPALEKMEAALRRPTSVEQKDALEDLIEIARGVTTLKRDLLPGEVWTQYAFEFSVHVPPVPGAPADHWTRNVKDLHFVVGKPGDTPIDHGNSTTTLIGFPDDWGGTYDRTRGEYDFRGRTPLVPCTRYTIKITTETFRRRGAPEPVETGFKWTDGNGQPIGDSGTTIGPAVD